MKSMLLAGGIGLLGVGAWGVASVLSSDALGVLLGLLFGLLATVPGCLLVLVTARRNAEGDPFRQPPPTVYQPPQPPAALLSGPVSITFEDQAGRRARVEFADPSAARRFLADGRSG